MSLNSLGLAELGVSPTTGFLPEADPLAHLPAPFHDWDDFAYRLPKLLMSSRLRPLIEALPPFPVERLASQAEWERAMVVLSFIGHAYVWGEARPADRLPRILAQPWHAVATRLGRPPVLSYASYCLHNWQRLDPKQPPELGNIALLQNFLAGEDEEWFILIHVEIERRAAPAMASLLPALDAVERKDEKTVVSQLGIVLEALTGMNEVMDRMEERCYPYIYFHRVRPFIHGWRNHPDLPFGVVYEGVDEYEGRPQTFRGETGAQSAIVPALDAFLGVDHAPDQLRTYLMEMREYMPPDQRRFLDVLEGRPTLRAFAQAAGGETLDAYNACVDQVERFRSTHLAYAAKFIHQQAQTDAKNPSQVGTGGTPFMTYLKKHRDETAEHRIGA